MVNAINPHSSFYIQSFALAYFTGLEQYSRMYIFVISQES